MIIILFENRTPVTALITAALGCKQEIWANAYETR